ncbi:hypothetical protein JXR93_06530 [bacterium]|nr:hypothetical protein [bacterium]
MKKITLIIIMLFSLAFFAEGLPPNANDIPNDDSDSYEYSFETKEYSNGDYKKGVRKKGTFFILEGNVGLSYPYSPSSDDYFMGFSSSILFGAGLKIPQTNLRFYLFTQFGFGNFKLSRDDYDMGEMFLKTTFIDLSIGTRLYIAFAGRNRFFTDFILSKKYLYFDYFQYGFEKDLEAEESDYGFKLGLGYQYRYSYRLSFGAKMEFEFPFGDSNYHNNVYVNSGYEESLNWINLYLTVVYHF